jgi:hypothetical protein
MDYDNFCQKCQHYNFTLQSGIICGLTNEKPAFEGNCEQYQYDPKRAPTIRAIPINKKKEHTKDLPDIDVALKKWGIGLIILGIIHLVLTKFLNPVWGVLIIILGILNLVIQKKEMFIANGIALLLVGILNIVGSLIPGSGNIPWIIFGLLQLYWGIREIQKYNKYKKEEIVENKKSSYPIVDPEITLDDIQKQKYSGFGVASFVVFCCTFLLMSIIFAQSVIYGLSNPDGLDGQSTHAAMLGFSMIFTLLIALVGIGLAITGLFQKGKKKTFATLGLIFNLIIFVLFVSMFFLG